MKVKDLMEQLESLPNDMEVVIPGEDHSFAPLHRGHVCKAEVYKNPGRRMVFLAYTEDQNKSDPNSPVVNVLCLG